MNFKRKKKPGSPHKWLWDKWGKGATVAFRRYFLDNRPKHKDKPF